ncbi:MAG: copper amine oxidase N-terminal domain-containing protein [Clostridiales bacterium]|nr:copper amine oxidase N-terminal domain-containing protein [Clostridiales bacterium]
MKKKWTICLIVAAILAVVSFLVLITAASRPIRVILDGTELTLDAQPRIVSDQTLVPLHGVLEAMGATVLWNGDSKTVTVLRHDSVVKLVIDNIHAKVNKENRLLDVPAQIFEDRIFVPLRFISESMGAVAGWDGAARTVTITTDKAHWSDPGDNLSLNLLFTSEWVNTDTGEIMTFDPEMFTEINDAWPDEYEGLFFYYSETDETRRNIIRLFLDGGHLKDHWYEFDPATQILSIRMFDEVLSRWHIAEVGRGEATD